ncbi:MAG: acyl--CoA ligase [Peptococcaceae bacterium]|nr:acyl--CoA ligase [Peptococcaceae bacterium]
MMTLEQIYSQGTSTYETWRLCNAEDFDSPAMEYFGNQLTYKQMDELIDVYARAFLKMMPDKTKSVTCCLPALPVAAYAFYALNKIGVKLNVVSHTVLPSDPKRYLEENDTEILILFDGFFPAVSAAIEKTNLNTIIVVSAADGIVTIPHYVPIPIRAKLEKTHSAQTIKAALPRVNVLSLDDFISIGRKNTETVHSIYKKGETAVILYTGGSTGIPKGVEKTNEELIAMGALYNQNGNLDQQRNERLLILIPPNHPTAFVHSIIVPGFLGILQVYQPFYDKNAFAADLYHSKSHHVIAAASHYATLPTCNLPDGALSCVRWALCGGEPVSQELALSINNALKRLGVQNPYMVIGYGMSEVGPLGMVTLGVPELLNKVGAPMRGVLARVVDDMGNEVGNNVRGHIQLKTPCHMKGYYKQPELTKEFFTEDGYAQTGDIGIRDDNGYYDIMGRAGDLIIASDNSKVYLFDIERVVYKDPAVLESEVVGIEIGGKKVPVVHIVLQADSIGRDTEVIMRVHKLCQEHLTENQMPWGYKIQEAFGTNPISQKRDYQSLALERDGYYMVVETLQMVSFQRDFIRGQAS